MICVLDVTSGPARGRRFWIRAEETLEIGRISSADFSVPSDRHMSRHHLILEGKKNSFRVRDVGSANGTFVNDAKVNAIELCSGDHIKAGETVFEVSVINDADNPHAKDVTFGSSAGDADQAIAVAEPPGKVRSSQLKVAPAKSNGGNGSAAKDPCLDESGSRESQLGGANAGIQSEESENLSIDDESTSRCNADEILASKEESSISERAWWTEFFFSPTDIADLYEQSEGAEEQNSISSLLKQLEASFAITAIINTEKLRRFDQQLVNALEAEGLVTWQGPAVCSVMDSCSTGFYLLVDSLVSQDALIVLGTKSGLDPNTIADISLKASRPSLIDREFRSQSSALREQICSEADFVLYEQGPSGRLSVLVHP